MRRQRDPESGRRGRRLRRRFLRPRPPIERPTPARRLRYWMRLAVPEFDGVIFMRTMDGSLSINSMHGYVEVRRPDWLAPPHRVVVYWSPFTAKVDGDKLAALEAHAALCQIQGRRVKINFEHHWAVEG